ncbi:uncharacterized protein LOC106705162 [Latimeria chalumnae]|uniref:uncharacterized protein LOC106705162 n=1 Tax=Latimeria chalumnae TaxID=7897 RepID=UPI00313CB9E0
MFGHQHNNIPLLESNAKTFCRDCDVKNRSQPIGQLQLRIANLHPSPVQNKKGIKENPSFKKTAPEVTLKTQSSSILPYTVNPFLNNSDEPEPVFAGDLYGKESQELATEYKGKSGQRKSSLEEKYDFNNFHSFNCINHASPSKYSNEESIFICTSELLLKSPQRRRPRLLPLNIRMCIEVRCEKHRTRAKCSPLLEELRHAADNMEIKDLTDLSEVEKAYHRIKALSNTRTSFKEILNDRCETCSKPIDWNGQAFEESIVTKSNEYLNKEKDQTQQRNNCCVVADSSFVTRKATAEFDKDFFEYLPPKKRYLKVFSELS